MFYIYLHLRHLSVCSELSGCRFESSCSHLSYFLSLPTLDCWPFLFIWDIFWRKFFWQLWATLSNCQTMTNCFQENLMLLNWTFAVWIGLIATHQNRHSILQWVCQLRKRCILTTLLANSAGSDSHIFRCISMDNFCVEKKITKNNSMLEFLRTVWT